MKVSYDMLEIKKNKRKPNVITKGFDLNEGLFQNSISLQGYRFFLLYLSRINPKDDNSNYVIIRLSDYCELMKIKKINRQSILQTITELLSNFIIIPNEYNGEDIISLFNICSTKKINGEWFLEFKAHEKLFPYIFNLKGYSKYEDYILSLPSLNTIRLYEICKQNLKLGKRKYSIDKLKQLLFIDKHKYTEFKVFRRDVIEKGIQIINRETDIIVSYECGGTENNGKTWNSIIFHIKENPDCTKNKINLLKSHNKDVYDFADFIANYVFEEQITSKQAQLIINVFTAKFSKFNDSPSSNDAEIAIIGFCKHYYNEIQDKIINGDISIDHSFYGYINQTIKQKLDEFNSFGSIPCYFISDIKDSDSSQIYKEYDKFKNDRTNNQTDGLSSSKDDDY